MERGGSTTPKPPGHGYRWYRAEKFGFAVAVPRRLEALEAAVDPVARMILGDARTAAAGLPRGFWDPEVVARRPDGSRQPLRCLEFAAIGIGSDERALGGRTAAWLRLDGRTTVPPLLDSLDLPGFAPLGVRDCRLGAHEALGFEYTWHGFAGGRHSGDHGLLVWWRSLAREYHVYYHCPQKEWERWEDELEAVLSTFVAF